MALLAERSISPSSVKGLAAPFVRCFKWGMIGRSALGARRLALQAFGAPIG